MPPPDASRGCRGYRALGRRRMADLNSIMFDVFKGPGRLYGSGALKRTERSTDARSSTAHASTNKGRNAGDAGDESKSLIGCDGWERAYIESDFPPSHQSIQNSHFTPSRQKWRLLKWILRFITRALHSAFVRARLRSLMLASKIIA